MAPSEQRGVGKRHVSRRRRGENAAIALFSLLDLRVEGICYVGSPVSEKNSSRKVAEQEPSPATYVLSGTLFITGELLTYYVRSGPLPLPRSAAASTHGTLNTR